MPLAEKMRIKVPRYRLRMSLGQSRGGLADRNLSTRVEVLTGQENRKECLLVSIFVLLPPARIRICSASVTVNEVRISSS